MSQPQTQKGRTPEEVKNDYDGFVEKFKPKRTTDDCLTPEPVYNAIRKWVNDNILPLDGVEIVRPFWPGRDYERAEYPDGCLVLDNPPFSILVKIRRFYHKRGVRYFLFAPALTMGYSARELDATYIVCGEQITYDNGAKVPTSFITNLDCGGIGLWVAGTLSKAITAAADSMKEVSDMPVYEYPAHVVSPAILQKIAKRGVEWRVPKTSMHAMTTLDSQRGTGKVIFGGGWLLSERAAAERAAAERAAAERAAAERAAARQRIVWPLSDREREIIRELTP